MLSQNLANLLKEETVVLTKIESCEGWHKNKVAFYEQGNLFLPFIDLYLNDLISVGKKIDIKYTNEFYEYSFYGQITDIKLGTLSYIIVQINDYKETINTRAFKRYDVFLPLSVRLNDQKISFFSIITNISLGGIVFLSNHPFDVGTESTLEIMLPDKKLIHVKGEILRQANHNENVIRYSMKFSDVNHESIQSLSNFLKTQDPITLSQI